MNNRHRDPKWKKNRANQTLRIELPDFEKARMRAKGKLSPDEIRKELKKAGVLPARKWTDRAAYITTTSTVIEPYVPPEGDGKATLLSKSGALQQMKQLTKKTQFMWHLRKLRQYEENFKVAEFAPEAHELYVKAHQTLTQYVPSKKEELLEFVTESGYADMVPNVALKTLRWTMVGSLEPPRVVQLKTQPVVSDDNVFGQVTVRMHTQQTLAVYDRFGRLMHGSEVMVKDVLEYVVFEKHISNLYGKWRLHAKIIPDWQPPKEPSKRTFIENLEEETTQSESAPDTVPQDGTPMDPAASESPKPAFA